MAVDGFSSAASGSHHIPATQPSASQAAISWPGVAHMYTWGMTSKRAKTIIAEVPALDDAVLWKSGDPVDVDASFPSPAQRAFSAPVMSTFMESDDALAPGTPPMQQQLAHTSSPPASPTCGRAAAGLPERTIRWTATPTLDQSTDPDPKTSTCPRTQWSRPAAELLREALERGHTADRPGGTESSTSATPFPALQLAETACGQEVRCAKAGAEEPRDIATAGASCAHPPVPLAEPQPPSGSLGIPFRGCGNANDASKSATQYQPPHVDADTDADAASLLVTMVVAEALSGESAPTDGSEGGAGTAASAGAHAGGALASSPPQAQAGCSRCGAEAGAGQGLATPGRAAPAEGTVAGDAEAAMEEEEKVVLILPYNLNRSALWRAGPPRGKPPLPRVLRRGMRFVNLAPAPSSELCPVANSTSRAESCGYCLDATVALPALTRTCPAIGRLGGLYAGCKGVSLAELFGSDPEGEEQLRALRWGGSHWTQQASPFAQYAQQEEEEEEEEEVPDAGSGSPLSPTTFTDTGVGADVGAGSSSEADMARAAEATAAVAAAAMVIPRPASPGPCGRQGSGALGIQDLDLALVLDLGLGLNVGLDGVDTGTAAPRSQQQQQPSVFAAASAAASPTSPASPSDDALSPASRACSSPGAASPVSTSASPSGASAFAATLGEPMDDEELDDYYLNTLCGGCDPLAAFMKHEREKSLELGSEVEAEVELARARSQELAQSQELPHELQLSEPQPAAPPAAQQAAQGVECRQGPEQLPESRRPEDWVGLGQGRENGRQEEEEEQPAGAAEAELAGNPPFSSPWLRDGGSEHATEGPPGLPTRGAFGRPPPPPPPGFSPPFHHYQQPSPGTALPPAPMAVAAAAEEGQAAAPAIGLARAGSVLPLPDVLPGSAPAPGALSLLRMDTPAAALQMHLDDSSLYFDLSPSQLELAASSHRALGDGGDDGGLRAEAFGSAVAALHETAEAGAAAAAAATAVAAAVAAGLPLEATALVSQEGEVQRHLVEAAYGGGVGGCRCCDVGNGAWVAAEAAARRTPSPLLPQLIVLTAACCDFHAVELHPSQEEHLRHQVEALQIRSLQQQQQQQQQQGLCSPTGPGGKAEGDGAVPWVVATAAATGEPQSSLGGGGGRCGGSGGGSAHGAPVDVSMYDVACTVDAAADACDGGGGGVVGGGAVAAAAAEGQKQEGSWEWEEDGEGPQQLFLALERVHSCAHCSVAAAVRRMVQDVVWATCFAGPDPMAAGEKTSAGAGSGCGPDWGLDDEGTKHAAR